MSQTSSSDLRKTQTISALTKPATTAAAPAKKGVTAPVLPAAANSNAAATNKPKRSRDTENDAPPAETKQVRLRVYMQMCWCLLFLQ